MLLTNELHDFQQMLMRKRIREAGKDLRDVFRDMDRDGSGAVSYDELKQLLRCVVCTCVFSL